MFTMSQIQFISDVKRRPGAPTDELCLKEMTNFTKKWAFFAKTCRALSLLSVPPTISPLCLRSNPSLPRGHSLRRGILGNV